MTNIEKGGSIAIILLLGYVIYQKFIKVGSDVADGAPSGGGGGGGGAPQHGLPDMVPPTVPVMVADVSPVMQPSPAPTNDAVVVDPRVLEPIGSRPISGATMSADGYSWR